MSQGALLSKCEFHYCFAMALEYNFLIKSDPEFISCDPK